MREVRAHAVQSHTSASGVGSPLNERSSRGSRCVARRIAHSLSLRATALSLSPSCVSLLAFPRFLFFFLSSPRDSQWGEIPFHTPLTRAHAIAQTVTTQLPPEIGSARNPAELEHFDTIAPFDSDCTNQEWFWFRVPVVMRYMASSMEKVPRLTKVCGAAFGERRAFVLRCESCRDFCLPYLLSRRSWSLRLSIAGTKYRNNIASVSLESKLIIRRNSPTFIFRYNEAAH